MAEDMTALVRRRATIKSQLTRIYNYVISLSVDLVDVSECQVRTQKVKDLWIEFDVIQSKIEDIDTSEAQLVERSNFESVTVEQGRQQAEASRVESIQQGKVRLPALDLPKFDGTYSQWSLFRDTFQALIEKNTTLENVQKFYYLKSCLQGNAVQVLQSLEMTADNYTIAWDLLKSRFENKRLLIHHHIQALFDTSPLAKESSVQLRKLIDDIQKHLRALKTLGEPVESWDSLIIHMTASRLDHPTRRKWESSLQDENLPTLKDLIQFLSKQCAVLEALQPAKLLNKNTASIPSAKKGESASAHVSQNAKGCIICQSQHAIYNCPTFKSLSIDDRLKEVKRNNQLCFNCLRADHIVNRCIAGGCKQCGRKHNTLLHINDGKPRAGNVHKKEQSETIDTQVSSKSNSAETAATNSLITYSAVSAQVKQNYHVLLATAPVIMYDKYGKSHRCRAFLDAGSQMNIISESLSQRLHLAKQKGNTVLSGIGCSQASTLGSTRAFIHSTVNEFKVELSFIIMNCITEPMPSIKIDKDALKIPENVQVADTFFDKPREVDILLGSRIFWDLLCIGQIKLGRNLPILQKTKLGWIIGGNAPISHSKEESSRIILKATVQDPKIEQQLKRFWELEECVPTTYFTPEEIQCEKEFEDTYQRDSTGKFIVKLLFQEDPTQLEESREAAVKRLHAVYKRLDSNPELKEQYSACLREYLTLGHMTKSNEEIDRTSHYCYYLPHHAIIKEDSSTTTLRIVFDASCKTSSGKSLNDILRVGPTIQQELFAILIRFRQHPYVLTGDIEKMFRQIYVHEEHRDLQRILWKEDSNAPIEEFTLNTVTFGLASSPFLAVRCLHQLAHDYQEIAPEISQIILRDFYMDDLITGASSVVELQHIQSKIKEILKTGGFSMRKWRSNVSEIVETDSRDKIGEQQALGEEIKTLGLY
ncbi:PREDICTED: uncharacterized protein LOC108781929 [Cyphomyrmex costatus]|uniref:uncharacterized protein LOC108781929 n=1 Tax=Cyphomyrmex costatus TaxID=456900 RepID=UPI0008524383|nr:PREDICTED: uncharacterized protein LOC108781929 [Cyphomyrmex costatus]